MSYKKNSSIKIFQIKHGYFKYRPKESNKDKKN
jgi:hypothetical protein